MAGLVYLGVMCARPSSSPPDPRESNIRPQRPGHCPDSPAPDRARAPAQKTKQSQACDVLVLGAGASGLFCAREAAGRGLWVTLLERAASPGRKLAISGGGKANFSNRQVTPAHYLCGDPGNDPGTGPAVGPDSSLSEDFCGPALRAFGPDDMLRLVLAWGLPFEERRHGQLFLTVPATRLVEALARDCRQRGCRLICNAPVSSVRHSEQSFEVTAGQEIWQARALVLALGSPACPQAGGNGTGYRLAQSLGHTLIAQRPVLSPLLLPATSPWGELAGLSLNACINLNDHKGAERRFEDDLLFTHDGLSGPLALKASLFWQEGQPMRLNFMPGADLAQALDNGELGRQSPRALLTRLLPQRLPQRLADALLPPDLARRKLAELSRAARRAIVEAVQACSITPAGVAGLKKAEACAGGVAVNEVDPQTLGSLRCRNLYIIGELLDVTGLLGGYNLHWAWAAGSLAGQKLLL